MEGVCAELERGADATRLVPLTKAVLERRDRTPTVEYERLVLSCARGIVRALSDAAGREAGSATEATSGVVADAELAVEQVAALASLFDNAAQSPRRGGGQPAAALKQLPAASPALRDPAAFDAIDACLETELPKLLPRRERGDEPGGDAAFRASLAARLELISAAVGRSPVLTIRLRAVRRLADGAVSRAKGLASVPASEGDLLADLAAAVCRAGVLAALLGPRTRE